MQTHHQIAELRAALAPCRRQQQRIGLVPTMGNLHEGHLQLIAEARRRCDIVVASIFVNPLQFGAGEDFDQYPRTLAADARKLEDAGCHHLFAPQVSEIYPDGGDSLTRVSVPALSADYCGASRPGHFEGVATVVTKLFGIVQPDLAVFGRKDFQQLAVIRRLTLDLCLPIDILGVPTQRDDSGLALSSRNQYLSTEERRQAPLLYQNLQACAAAIAQGRQDYATLEAEARERLAHAGFRPDYFRICRTDDLQPARGGDHQLVILAAAHLGRARLIDNLECEAP